MAEESSQESPSDELAIESLSTFDPFTYDFIGAFDQALEWSTNYIIQPNTIYQAVIIVSSFVLAFILYRSFKNKLSDYIEQTDLPSRAKRVANNIRRLLYPLLTLIVIFAITNIASSKIVGVDVALVNGMMKVLFAWIVIRIMVQFIDNSAVRNIFAFGIWAVAALSIFNMLDTAMETLDAIGFAIGNFRLSALVVIKSIFYLFILLYFATFVSSFAERRVLKATGLTRSSQVLIAKIIRVVLIVVALLIGVTSSGIDLSLFAVFGGAIGLGIGFGLQKGISNLFAGMLLLIDRSIEPGDVIELENGTFGWVNNMAARYTEIVTRDNKSFLIPNEEFITQRVVNWNHGNDLIRISVPFGVHYKSDPHEVIKIAIEACQAPKRVLSNPTPVCWITDFGDSSINFTLRFWIKDAQNGLTNVRGAVLLALWDGFKKHGIEIPYPHREVYIHNPDPTVEAETEQQPEEQGAAKEEKKKQQKKAKD